MTYEHVRYFLSLLSHNYYVRESICYSTFGRNVLGNTSNFPYTQNLLNISSEYTISVIKSNRCFDGKHSNELFLLFSNEKLPAIVDLNQTRHEQCLLDNCPSLLN